MSKGPSRKHRTTTLAIPADDESNLMPTEPESDYDDDESTSILTANDNNDIPIGQFYFHKADA